MPPGSRYVNRSKGEEEIFVNFYAKLASAQKLRKKILEPALHYFIITVLVCVSFTCIAVIVFWSPTGPSGLWPYIVSGTIAVLSILALLANFALIIWGNAKISETRVAHKIFTVENLQKCDSSGVRGIFLLNEKPKKVLLKNLNINIDHLAYMQVLVNEGYEGSIMDLGATVKKLY